MVQAIALVSQCVAYITFLYEQLFTRLGAVPVYMMAVSIVMACRYMLQPILGGVGSDFAREVNNQGKHKSSSQSSSKRKKG